MPDLQSGPPGAAIGRAIGAVIRIAMLAAEIVLVLMMAMIATEVITRNVFDYSLQVTDELSGYLLVALTFLSIGVSLHDGAFFRVEFVFERLPPRAQGAVSCLFISAALVFAIILDWHLVRLVQSSFRRGKVEPSLLATPLWIPQIMMPLGTTLLVLVLLGMLTRQIAGLIAGRGRRP